MPFSFEFFLITFFDSMNCISRFRPLTLLSAVIFFFVSVGFQDRMRIASVLILIAVVFIALSVNGVSANPPIHRPGPIHRPLVPHRPPAKSGESGEGAAEGEGTREAGAGGEGEGAEGGEEGEEGGSSSSDCADNDDSCHRVHYEQEMFGYIFGGTFVCLFLPFVVDWT